METLKKAGTTTPAKTNKLHYEVYPKKAEASRTNYKLFAEIRSLLHSHRNPFLSQSERAVCEKLLCSTIRKFQILQNGTVKLTRTVPQKRCKGAFLNAELTNES